MNWRKHISAVPVAGVLMTLLLLGLGASRARVIQDLNNSFYGTLVRLHLASLEDDRIVIVDIDEASLRRHGQWPWSRYLLAEMTDRILESGARVLAFDMVFAEPDRSSPRLLRDELDARFGVAMGVEQLPENLQDFDMLFARSLAKGQTILGCFLHEVRTGGSAEQDDPSYQGRFYWKGTGDFRRTLPKALGITLSVPALRDAAANSAFFNTKPDPDNIVRSTPLVWAFGSQRLYPSLALEAVRAYLGVEQVGLEYDTIGITGLRLDDRLVPTDARGRLIINYRAVEKGRRSVHKTFPSVAAGDVLEGRMPPGFFKDKLVFVGTSAAGLLDIRATPVTPEFAGVEIQATVAENILTGRFLKRPAWIAGFDFSATLVAGLLVTWILARGRSWLSFVLTAGLIVGVAIASVLLFRMARVVFIPTGLIAVVLIIYPVLSMIRYWQQEQRTRWLRNTFGAMVSQKVLSYMEANPASATAPGRRTEATILFVDVQGFTRISEELEPEVLSELMNLYLSRMEGVIRRHDGYVDKFVGDAVMAEWGVPLHFERHAEQACRAALDMVAAVKDLRQEFVGRCGRELRIRIGINTGSVTAGNMGSSERFNYTVLGDAVNLADRLEKLNKDYGTTIIVSEFTRAQAGDAFRFRLLDRVVVKGKTKAVEVYELLTEEAPPAG
jgi:adenylate cyclase